MIVPYAVYVASLAIPMYCDVYVGMSAPTTSVCVCDPNLIKTNKEIDDSVRQCHAHSKHLQFERNITQANKLMA